MNKAAATAWLVQTPSISDTLRAELKGKAPVNVLHLECGQSSCQGKNRC